MHQHCHIVCICLSMCLYICVSLYDPVCASMQKDKQTDSAMQKRTRTWINGHVKLAHGRHNVNDMLFCMY